MTVINETAEEKCLAAMADVLSTLDDWPYRQTPMVDRVIPPPANQMESKDLPRLFVVPARGSQLTMPAGNRTGRVYRHELRVNVHGLVEADPETTADTWRWRLRRAVLATLHLNLSLNGTASMIDFSGQPEEIDAGEIAPKAWFMQPVTVWLLEEYPTAA